MNFIKKTFNEFCKDVKDTNDVIEALKEPTVPVFEPEEEWIWVEGYKGTDKDMKCRGYQYELGVQYDMSEGQRVEECKSGFHLCLSLEHVYRHYNISDGHRFFRVKALVRKSDADKYGSMEYIDCGGMRYATGLTVNKLTSKSIIFLSELTSDEILKDTEIYNLPSQHHKTAIDHSINFALTAYQRDTLIADGYSEPFVCHIISINKFDVAHAVGSQKDLSMDIKVLAILYDKKGA